MLTDKERTPAVRRSCGAVYTMAVAWMLAIPCYGQWLKYPTPGIPRTQDGKPNLSILNSEFGVSFVEVRVAGQGSLQIVCRPFVLAPVRQLSDRGKSRCACFGVLWRRRAADTVWPGRICKPVQLRISGLSNESRLPFGNTGSPG
jgi:hypothetical protein